MTEDGRCSLVLATPDAAGAVAILQLQGPGAAGILSQLTGADNWTPARLRLVDMAGIDRGLAVLLTPQWVQLMPHGGLRVVQRLVDRLMDLGATPADHPDPGRLYPEASSRLEARMLATLALAASPMAIDLLLAQPGRWQRLLDEPAALAAIDRDAVESISTRLDRLVKPPVIVVVGAPNVGKSTLTNHMLGHAASIVADLPGTTRDWVGGVTELSDPASGKAGVAVRWLDTPGVRPTQDMVEREAIAMAGAAMRTADVLIAMTAPGTGWPPAGSLPRQPDLWLLNKSDQLPRLAGGDGHSPGHPLPISATVGTGIAQVGRLVLAHLGLLNMPSQPVWAFYPRLKDILAAGDTDALAAELATQTMPLRLTRGSEPA